MKSITFINQKKKLLIYKETLIKHLKEKFTSLFILEMKKYKNTILKTIQDYKKKMELRYIKEIENLKESDKKIKINYKKIEKIIEKNNLEYENSTKNTINTERNKDNKLKHKISSNNLNLKLNPKVKINNVDIIKERYKRCITPLKNINYIAQNNYFDDKSFKKLSSSKKKYN